MFFVVFEGLDGSGKSSLMKMLADHLKENKIETLLTREPGGTPLGDEIRNLILRKDGQSPSARAELLLYQASRSQHVDLVIKPALDDKKWVLCDRFTASSLAFQGGGRGISEEQVIWLSEFSTHGLKPQLTVLLDLSVEESQKRQQKRTAITGETADRMESEKNDFHERVRSNFVAQAKKDPQAWLVLDASQTPAQLFEILITHLRSQKMVV